MKISLAQIECIPGQPYLNYIKIKEYTEKAISEKTNMIIFPENIVPGYLIGDTLEEESYLKDCMKFNEDIKLLSNNIYIVFGSIYVDFNGTYTDGRCIIYNSLFVAYNKEFLNLKPNLPFHAKALLPNYREFEEPRHFKSALSAPFYTGTDYFTPITINDIKIGFTICECGWDEHYKVKPTFEYVKRGAQLIINISSSPYTERKNKARDRVFGQGHAKTNKIPLIYTNNVGMQNTGKSIYTFDGSSVVYNTKGEIVFQAPMFEQGLYYVEYKDGDLYPITESYSVPTGTEETVKALKYGTKKFLEMCHTNKVVIGASGGIDSCVSASLFAQIVGPENLLLVNMPSRFNSQTTKDTAKKLAENIGCYYTVIPIEDSVELTKKQMNGLQVQRKSDINERTYNFRTLNFSSLNLENIQARDRGSRILAALASAWGGVFPCNGNKAELCVGYGTLMGDIEGFFAPLGDLWKHQVYEVGRYMNQTYPVIPEEAFSVVPSAELSENQDVTKGKGDPLTYYYHDRLFESWQKFWFRCTPEENLKWYLDGTINEKLGIKDENLKTGPAWPLGKWDDVYKLFPTVKVFTDDLERWYKLFKGMGAVKRQQAPPILCCSRRCMGTDFRDYITGDVYFTREYHRMKEKAIKEGL